VRSVHPRLVDLLPDVAAADAADGRVHVFVGTMVDTAESESEAGEIHTGADFVVAAEDVESIPAECMHKVLAGHDPSSLIVEVTGVDEAAIIAGQVLAIASGVRALVAADVEATRRAAVMIEQVLIAKSLRT